MQQFQHRALDCLLLRPLLRAALTYPMPTRSSSLHMFGLGNYTKSRPHWALTRQAYAYMFVPEETDLVLMMRLMRSKNTRNLALV